MSNQLSLSARPNSFKQVVGQAKVKKIILGQIGSGRVAKAWLFSGSKGTGKTTMARIVANSLQCSHGSVFGTYCKQCKVDKAAYLTMEINCADITGIDKMRELLEGSSYGTMGDSKYRIYILDEVHGLSNKAQELLLKYLEDTPETTIFILCSTKPWKIDEPVRSRCISFEFKELTVDELPTMVQWLLKKVESEMEWEPLVDALVERRVGSHRLVAMAVEKYLAGATPNEAAQVEGTTTVDIKALTRNITKGAWPEVCNYLATAEGLNMRDVRLGLLAYLRAMLLASPEITERTAAVAKAIKDIAILENTEDLAVSAGLTAAIYHLTALFARYQR